MSGLFLGLLVCGSLLALPPVSNAADSSTDSDLALEYIKLVQKHVDKNWSYKKTLDNQFYSVQATVQVDRDGKILETRVDRVSSDKKFNDEALKQLAAMDPFPKFSDDMQQNKFEIRLHLMPNAH
jgi:outer membrane biosynthesis protein TonB